MLLKCYPVLHATHRKAVGLIVSVPVDRGVAGVQVTVPSGTAGHKGRPQVRVGALIVERTIGIAVASEEALTFKIII